MKGPPEKNSFGARVGQINEVEEMDGVSGDVVFEDNAAVEVAAGAAGAAA